MTEGVYRRKIMYKNVMRKGAELREAGLLEEHQNVADLFNNEEMIKLHKILECIYRWVEGIT